MGPIAIPAGDGDPTVAAFREAVRQYNSIPFSVQGSSAGVVIDGMHTMAYEIVAAVTREQACTPQDAASGGGAVETPRRGIGSVYVQVGGGGLGSGLFEGLRRAVDLGALPNMPTLNVVQPEGNAPFHRAYSNVVWSLLGGQPAPPPAEAEAAVQAAAGDRDRFMFPWSAGGVNPPPRSVASGILDEETYDWVGLIYGVLGTGGRSLVVNDATVLDAAAAALTHAPSITPCITGVSGLAGLMHDRQVRGMGNDAAPPIVLFTGVDREAWQKSKA
jgi:threonine synthase